LAGVFNQVEAGKGDRIVQWFHALL
jgi:hypothetical protein